MKYKEILKLLVVGTLLSVMLFFAISFVTVLFSINSPLVEYKEYYQLEIGFPFTYYKEFIVDCPSINWGWNIINLIIDCFIIWLISILSLIIYKRKK